MPITENDIAVLHGKLRGNDSYRNNFITVKYEDQEQNGLPYGEPYLIVQCPKARSYVSGAVYKKTQYGWQVIQVDQVIDNPDTPEIENELIFELTHPSGLPFERGTYCVKTRTDGQGWDDEFVIGDII